MARLVQARVHPGRDLHAACEGEAHVNAVHHAVGLECATDLVDDLLVGGDVGERQRLGGVPQAVQVLDQPEDAPVVEPQAFPHAVTPLHDAVEWADAGLIAMDELAADVDDEIPVPLIKLLKDDPASFSRAR